MIIRLYDFDSEVGLASRRMEGSTLTTGATPSIAGHDWFVLVYSSATTITNFTNPTNGQIIHLLAANANTTIAHGTNIKLVGATNWAMPSEVTLTLMYYAAGPAWYEIARTSATTTTLTVNADTAETNTVHDMLVMKHSTSGTPAAGFGARQIFALESSTTVGQTAAYLETLWTDATHASRTALLRGSATGNAANTGFFGHWNHSPVAGTALTIIPNAAGDVTEITTFLYAVSEVSGTGTSGGMVPLTPNGGSVSLYSDGTDTLQIACASDGSVTIQRSAGTDEFKVSLWGTWL